MFCDHRSILR